MYPLIIIRVDSIFPTSSLIVQYQIVLLLALSNRVDRNVERGKAVFLSAWGSLKIGQWERESGTCSWTSFSFTASRKWNWKRKETKKRKNRIFANGAPPLRDSKSPFWLIAGHDQPRCECEKQNVWRSRMRSQWRNRIRTGREKVADFFSLLIFHLSVLFYSRRRLDDDTDIVYNFREINQTECGIN